MSRILLSTVFTCAVYGTALAQAGGGGAAPQPSDPAATPPPAEPSNTAPAVGTAAPPAPPPSTAAATPPAAAPAPKTPLTITGYIDTTYNYNVNRPSTRTNGLFSYNAKHNNLTLNAAHLSLSGEPEEGLSYTVDIDAGADAVLNTSNLNAATAPAYTVDVQEAYATYKRGKWGIRAGKFATFNGIELIESPLDPTVSRGYLYGLAEPVTHTGAEVFVQANDMIDVHVGVVNGWDVVLDNNRAKTGLFKVGIVPNDKTSITISGFVGAEGTRTDKLRETVDVTALVKLAPVDLNLQANFGREDAASAKTPGDDASWFGAGIQPVLHLSDTTSIAGRVEFFKDSDGARTGVEQQLFNVSLAPAYALSPHFMVRAEARLDISDQEIFATSDSTSKTQVVLLGEAIAAF